MKSPNLHNDSLIPMATEAYQATQYLLRRKTPPWLYYKFRTFTRRYPSIFLPFSRWRWDRWRKQYGFVNAEIEPAAPEPFTKNTEIVIEGFPRTANTFAHIAFKMVQERPIKIAHHTHAAAQVIAGARKKIPTIVLIREPEAAILSYLIGNFDPEIGLEQLLWDFIYFYEPILPYRDCFVVGSFETVTKDYASVIRKVNEKYGTQFQVFENTEANVKHCFELIDLGYEAAFGKLSETVVSRPVESREQLKKDLQEQFHSAKLAPLRQRALQVYETLMTQA
jgi:hypothetical protein